MWPSGLGAAPPPALPHPAHQPQPCGVPPAQSSDTPRLCCCPNTKRGGPARQPDSPAPSHPSQEVTLNYLSNCFPLIFCFKKITLLSLKLLEMSSLPDREEPSSSRRPRGLCTVRDRACAHPPCFSTDSRLPSYSVPASWLFHSSCTPSACVSSSLPSPVH